MFKDSELYEFDLCTNTDLDLSDKLKNEDDRNLPPATQKYNNLVQLWRGFLEEEVLDDDVLLFFPGIRSKKYKFKPEAAGEVKKLVQNLFANKDFQTKLLKGHTVIIDKLNCTQMVDQAYHVEEANTICEQLKILSNSTKPEKGKFLELGKKVQNLREYFLIDNKCDDVVKLFEKTKVNDSLYLTRRTELYNICVHIIQNTTDAVEKARNKLDSFRNSHLPEGKLLNDEITNINERKNQFSELRNVIWNSTDLTDLRNRIVNFPHAKNELESLSGNKLNFNNLQKKFSLFIENSISDCVLLELAADEQKLNNCIHEFLEKFRLLTCYPDVDKLNALLKREMREKFPFLNVDLITDSFQKQMLDWFKEYNKGKSDFLSFDQGHTFFTSIGKHIKSLMTVGLNEAYPSKLRSFNIQFKQTLSRQFFFSSNNILHMTTDSTILSAIKFLQMIEESKLYEARDSFIFLPLSGLVGREIQKLVIESFNDPNRHDLLVIECQKQIKLNTFPYISEFIDNIARILNENNKKKLIMITEKGCKYVDDEFATFEGVRIETFLDQNTFRQLEGECQKHILNSSIILQDALIPLGEIISLKIAQDIINETVLETMLLNTVQIGDNDTFTSSYFVAEYYQQRYLNLQSVDFKVLDIPAIFYITSTEDDDYLNIHYNETWRAISQKRDVIVKPKPTDNHERVFEKLCEDNPDKIIYWLHQNHGKLYWKRLNKAIKCTAVSSIQDHIIENSTFSETGFYYEKTLNLSEKVMIIANNPGVGKSTFLTSIARNMKNQHKNWWICRINLSDYVFDRKYLPLSDNRIYTKNLEEIIDNLTTDQAIDFLAEMIIPPNPLTPHHEFQRDVFKSGLRYFNDIYPHLVILFDGFDEISPLFKTKTIKLISCLRNTSIAQIWITTRLHEKCSLEEEFQHPAYVLHPFDEYQQINFLTTFWQYSLQKRSTSDQNFEDYISTIISNLNINGNYARNRTEVNELSSFLELESFAENLIQEWKSSATDENKTFTNNPLHLKMIAEIVLLKDFQWIYQIGLVNLFEEFLNLKFEIFYREKQILGQSVGAFEVRKDHSEPLRQKHRLLAFRTIYPDMNNDVDDPVNDGDTSSLTRVGLLIRIGSRLTFIHRTFAEFLVVEFLTLTLNKDITQRVLFEHVFSEGRHSFMGSVFNDFVLKRPLDMALKKPTIELINTQVERTYNDIFLHHLYYGCFDNTLTFVLKVLKHHPEIQEKVLLKPGKYGKFAIYDITHNVSRGRSPREQQTIIKMYLDYLVDQPDFLVKIFTTRYRELDLLLGTFEPFVTCFQIALLSTGTEKIFELFVDSVKHSKKHFKDILFENGMNNTDNILHFCCRFAYTKLQLLVRCLTPSNLGIQYIDVLNDLILAKDSNDRTPLHWLSFNLRYQCIDIFISWVKRISENTLITLLNSVDRRSINSLDMAIYRDDIETTKAFLDSLNTNLSEEQFGALVFAIDSRISILYKAISQGKTKSMITILEWLKIHYAGNNESGIDFIINMLMEKHYICGRLSISLAFCRDFCQTVEELLDWIKKNYKESYYEVVFRLLVAQDYDGSTVFHYTATYGKTISLETLMLLVTKHFSSYKLAEFLLTKNNNNRIALDMTKSPETKHILWEQYEIILNTVLELSNITDISEYPVTFTESQLNTVEEIIQNHLEENKVLMIEAVTTIRLMMGFDYNMTAEAINSSERTSQLALPP